MATAEEISLVRTMAGENNDRSDYPDDQIEKLFDESGASIAAATIWGWKAGKFATMVDVTESGSSRKMSDLHKNALTMKSHYLSAAGVGGGDGGTGSLSNRTRTRPIVRPTAS